MNDITYYARLGYATDGICVTFPDLPGCFTEGKSRDEAIKMASGVLDLWLNVDDDAIVINKPSRLDNLEIHADSNRCEYEDRYEFVPITIIK